MHRFWGLDSRILEHSLMFPPLVYCIFQCHSLCQGHSVAWDDYDSSHQSFLLRHFSLISKKDQCLTHYPFLSPPSWSQLFPVFSSLTNFSDVLASVLLRRWICPRYLLGQVIWNLRIEKVFSKRYFLCNLNSSGLMQSEDSVIGVSSMYNFGGM